MFMMIGSRHLKNYLSKASQLLFAREICRYLLQNFTNLRNDFSFATRNIKSVHYSSETITYLGPKIWDLLLKTLKIQKTITFSSEMLSFGSLRTVYVVWLIFI